MPVYLPHFLGNLNTEYDVFVTELACRQYTLSGVLVEKLVHIFFTKTSDNKEDPCRSV